MKLGLNSIIGLVKFKKAFQFILGFILLFIFIEFLSYAFFLPDSGSILIALKFLFNEGILLHDISVSSARWIIGWSVGSSLGILFGIITGRNKIIATFIEGFILILRAVPFIALVPLVIYIFGLAESGKFFIIGWASFSVTWAVIHESSRKVSQMIYWRSRSLGVNKISWIFKIMLPHINSSILSALRTSLSLGLIVVAVAELSGVYEYSASHWWSEGIGYRIFRASDQARDDIMMASILVFSFLGITYDFILSSTWKMLSSVRYYFKKKSIIKKIKMLTEVSTNKQEILLTSAADLEIRNLSARYSDFKVFDDFNVELKTGSVLSIVGESGSGKSTLLKSIGHFNNGDLQSIGTVLLNSNEIDKVSSSIGIVFQEPALFDNLTIWENVIIGNNIRAIEDKILALNLIKNFGLLDKLTEKASNLSGGQRQRLALASAIANKPLLLLLDEPFGALDAITRHKLQRFFNEKINGKITSVFVTHDINEAIIIGNKVIVGLKKGKKEFIINNEKDVSGFEFTEQFVGLKKSILSALEND
ncbi:ATP-binding cassette domain-containing protein [Flavivirga rizhaonensis]|nr:ATP-binding cassette domain-containing protein [Flavivirga rizhaonensis]